MDIRDGYIRVLVGLPEGPLICSHLEIAGVDVINARDKFKECCHQGDHAQADDPGLQCSALPALAPVLPPVIPQGGEQDPVGDQCVDGDSGHTPVGVAHREGVHEVHPDGQEKPHKGTDDHVPSAAEIHRQDGQDAPDDQVNAEEIEILFKSSDKAFKEALPAEFVLMGPGTADHIDIPGQHGQHRNDLPPGRLPVRDQPVVDKVQDEGSHHGHRARLGDAADHKAKQHIEDPEGKFGLRFFVHDQRPKVKQGEGDRPQVVARSVQPKADFTERGNECPDRCDGRKQEQHVRPVVKAPPDISVHEKDQQAEYSGIEDIKKDRGTLHQDDLNDAVGEKAPVHPLVVGLHGRDQLGQGAHPLTRIHKAERIPVVVDHHQRHAVENKNDSKSQRPDCFCGCPRCVVHPPCFISAHSKAPQILK